MKHPEIVYLQTTTQCNGHCVYCPFDDIYKNSEIINMDIGQYKVILQWLKSIDYCGRIGFLLHYEPTLDPRLSKFISIARNILPGLTLEAATNGIKKTSALSEFDVVDCVLAGSRNIATSRAGNVKACKQIKYKIQMGSIPCHLPLDTMCIAANGDVLLCCQDWRHEAVVGTINDLSAARAKQLSLINSDLELCKDCMMGKTAEEVGNRLGKRFI